MSKESNFDRLASHIKREYEAKGIPPEKAAAWAEGTARKVGIEEYGKDGFENLTEKGKEKSEETRTTDE